MSLPIILMQLAEASNKADSEPPDYQTLIISIAGMAMLSAMGYWLIKRIKDENLKDQKSGHNMFTTFRELHEQGELSDEEYKKIKGSVIQQLKEDELKDDDEAV